MLDILALIVLAAATGVVAVILYPFGELAPESKPKPSRPKLRPSAMWDTGVWVPGWPHEAPEEPPTVEQARSIMQSHKGCSRAECGRKRAAWDTLVAAGLVVPRGAR
ncbi:hypothetical protein [Nocardia cyriacigeorgica]|uniref:Uncharacterized protein n=1 Tax=Nocardia cyriacigeorgica TaxID=135487 RepID=A0A5R8NEM7_9NOCA|nr:hypothetical protein [Nocardia cyriacigeorgica]TLF74074.1 hypothetical protein FEK34_25480 [Nocardia cyriacigeorgica]